MDYAWKPSHATVPLSWSGRTYIFLLVLLGIMARSYFFVGNMLIAIIFWFRTVPIYEVKLKIIFVKVFHMSQFLTKLFEKYPKNRFKIHLITDFSHILYTYSMFFTPSKDWKGFQKCFPIMLMLQVPIIMLMLQVPTNTCRSYPPFNWQILSTFQFTPSQVREWKLVKQQQGHHQHHGCNQQQGRHQKLGRQQQH